MDMFYKYGIVITNVVLNSVWTFDLLHQKRRISRRFYLQETSRAWKNWHIFIKKKNILEGFPNLIKLSHFVTCKNSIRIVTRGNKAPSIKYLHPWMVCFPPVNYYIELNCHYMKFNRTIVCPCQEAVTIYLAINAFQFFLNHLKHST